MFHLDAKLFATHRSSGYIEDEWREILGHLVGKLEEFLGQPVATSDIRIWPKGLAGEIACPVPFAGLLEFSWFGRIGVTVLGHDERTYPEVAIFLRAAGKRLVTIGGRAFLLLEYQELEADGCGWTAPEWWADDLGEYQDWG